MRKSLTLSFVTLLLAIVLLAPIASGADVNVLEVKDGYDKTVHAPETVSFTWVVFNNDTAPYLVQVDAQIGKDSAGIIPADINLGIEQNYSALGPGESRQIIIQVTASKAAQSDDFPIYANISFSKMSDPSQVEVVSESATVHAKAMFESSGNKIFGTWENTLPSPFNTLIWSFIFTILLWVGVAGLIYFIVDPLVQQFTKKTKTDLDDRIMAVIRMPLFALIVIFGIVDSLAILDIPQEWHISIMQMYQILVAIIAAWVAFRIFDKVVIYYAEKWAKTSDTEIDDVLVPLLHKLGIVIIPVAGIMAVLSVIGVDVTLLVAGMGVIGLVVAFAAQETLGNLFAGLQLLMDRPFKVGDIIKLDSGQVCRIEKIGLRSTQMYNTFDHDIIIMPNNDVANSKVENYSRPDKRHEQYAEVGVAYGTDLEKVKNVLLGIANDHPDVIKQKDQMPYIRMAKFGESSIDFKLWYWVDLPNMWRVASDVRMAIDKRFKEEGIEIPFPQSVVTFKNAPPK